MGYKMKLARFVFGTLPMRGVNRRVPMTSSPCRLFTAHTQSTATSHFVQRVCIVGSGPSGFYTAKYLLDKADSDKNVDLRVDMLEKLPTPFGLVRYGVAPDHPEVKIVAEQFTEVAKNPRFRFFGNVTVGDGGRRDTNGCNDNEKPVCDVSTAPTLSSVSVSVAELLAGGYSAVVLAYGSESNRLLGIPGENLNGVLSAREFVNWYNGHPNFVYVGDKVDLSQTKNVVIVGQGNVALDCARLLAKPLCSLQTTDLTASSLRQLASSAVTDIHVAGRRGHVQAAFTIKELRELTKIPNVRVRILQSELEEGSTASSEEEVRTRRPLKRITDLVTTTAATSADCFTDIQKEVHLRFLMSPLEVKEGWDESEQVSTGTVRSVVFAKCRLDGPPHQQKAIPTGDTEEIPCDLLLSAVGYKTLPLPGVPFDTRTNTIPHSQGRVLMTPSSTSEESIPPSLCFPGLYVSGWCKRGPVGIVGSNITDAKETVGSILADLASRKSATRNDGNGTAGSDPASWLTSRQQVIVSDENGSTEVRAVSEGRVVSWQDHLALDSEERRRGLECTPVPKPREKVTNVKDMFDIISQQDEDKGSRVE